jgi:hypothetical protein
VDGTIMITEKAMIATMIMDTIDEIAMEGSDNDQQKETVPTSRDGFYLFVFKPTALLVFSASTFARVVFCLVMNVLTDFLYDSTSAFGKVVMLP